MLMWLAGLLRIGWKNDPVTDIISVADDLVASVSTLGVMSKLHGERDQCLCCRCSFPRSGWHGPSTKRLVIQFTLCGVVV